MFKITPEFLSRNARIALFAIAGFFINKGYLESSVAESVIGFVVGLLSYGWSLWGNRLVAKINEIVKNDNFIVLAPAETANAVPSASVVPVEQVTVSGPRNIVTPLNNANSNVTTEQSAAPRQ